MCARYFSCISICSSAKRRRALGYWRFVSFILTPFILRVLVDILVDWLLLFDAQFIVCMACEHEHQITQSVDVSDDFRVQVSHMLLQADNCSFCTAYCCPAHMEKRA